MRTHGGIHLNILELAKTDTSIRPPNDVFQILFTLYYFIFLRSKPEYLLKFFLIIRSKSIVWKKYNDVFSNIWAYFEMMVYIEQLKG